MGQSINIIAFGHRRRVGKDTAVKLGVTHLKSMGIKNAFRLSFIERVKNLCHDIYSWGGLEDAVYYENHPDKKDEILAPIGRSPRQIWISFGEMLYEICPHGLCEMAFQNLKPGIYLISDLRRPIEADYVKKFGGHVIKIHNDRVERHDDPVDSHMEGYDGWDETIGNNGTMREFNQTVIELLNRRLKL